ncbi:gamma-glutamyl-gamma-aminobutyrate hydrolase family protein [Chungangia koreensis]|uniref:Gamma-glutamyl-gamma-aminobutyrate hydrolase family protein n=1 Tax=Chungangia koreensis TaxID=752657 RepID=A0ABV8X3D6_9LACT
MKPLIGITAEIREGNYFLPPIYSKVVIQAGGIPVLIPQIPDEDIQEMCNQIDALLVTGGEDIDPGYYGQEPHVDLGIITPRLDRMEYLLVQEFLKQDKPYIGICRGLHMLNVVNGGSLYQSIHTEREKEVIQHKQKAPRTHRAHTVKLEKDSRMFELLGEDEFKVNSFHHQACNKVPDSLKIVATAKDGIIEGVESPEHSFVFGFQWHPEEFAWDGDEPSQHLFKSFIDAAVKRKELNR